MITFADLCSLPSIKRGLGGVVIKSNVMSKKIDFNSQKFQDGIDFGAGVFVGMIVLAGISLCVGVIALALTKAVMSAFGC